MKMKMFLCALAALFSLVATATADGPFKIEDVPAQGKWILVNLSNQILSVGQGRNPDQKPIFATPVSTGRRGHATPVDVRFKVIRKVPNDKSETYNAHMPNNLRLGGDTTGKYKDGEFGIHASRHAKWESPLSHGCMRVSPEASEWLMANIEVGTPVFIEGNIEDYYREHFCPEDLLVIKGDEVVCFKVATASATDADRAAFLKLIKSKEIPLRYDPFGVRTNDKKIARFMWPFMPPSAGLSVAKFEQIYRTSLRIGL